MTTLIDVLNRGREKFAESVALKIKPRYRYIIWNYLQLYNFATGVAKLLEEKKLNKGDRVLLWAPNSPYWWGAFLGCQLKGIIVVPLYLQNRPKFVLNIAQKTRAKLLLKSAAIKKPPQLKLPFVNIDYLDELIAKEHLFKRVPINSEDIVQILYTSGTTGFPKGAVLTHKNIVSDLKAIFNIIEVKKSDRFLSILPLSHIFEQIVELRALAGGAQIVFAPALGSTIIIKTLFENKITKMTTVPEFLKLVMQKIEARIPPFLFKIAGFLPFWSRRLLFKKVHHRFGGKLNLIVSGGAALDVGVGRKWQALGINILQGYGLTETSPVITVTPPPFKKIASVGKVVPGIKVKIAKDGEILVRGPIVFKEYWRDPQKTREAFTNGWFKTGDMGYFDKEGFLYLRGRKKFMVLTAAGQNVYPEDIEFELNKERGVVDSCVVGLPKKGKIEIHAVVLGEIKEKELERIIDRVNKRLASFQQIQSWSCWPFSDFPRTIIKKVKRPEVLEYLTQKTVPEEVKLAQKEAPPLIEILSTITQTTPSLISGETRIVKDLKLDSLMRIELISQIEEQFGVEINEAKITPETTVEDLEKLIEEKPKKEIKHKITSWQLLGLTKKIRKILQQYFFFALLKTFSRVEVSGEENLQNLSSPVFFMPNHTSWLDGPSVVRALPPHFRDKIATATASDVLYEKLKPLHLLAILLLNSYPFSRYSQIKSGLEHTGQLIDKGWSILFFPEGRESKTGKLLPLKLGAGMMAIEMQIPIIPVKIEGARDIVPSGSRFPKKRGRILVKFGPPLYFKKWTDPDKATKAIEKALKKL